MRRNFKRRLLLLALAASLINVGVLCRVYSADGFKPEYPNDPPIDVCPQEYVGYESLGVLDYADAKTTLDGWTARDGVALERGEKTLVIHSETSDPYIFSPMIASFVPSEKIARTKGKILVKINVRRANKGDGQIFFAQESNRGYDEGHSARFRIPKGDDSFHEYLVPLDVDSPLLRLRFDIGGDEGDAEIARIELIKVLAKPFKFGAFTVKDGAINFNLVNGGSEPTTVETKYIGVDPRKTYPGSTVEISEPALVDVYYPQKKPFEEVNVVVKSKATQEELSRRFFVFNESVADKTPADGLPTLKSGAVEVRFAPDGSGAEIFRDGKRAAIISPLVCEEGDGAAILPNQIDFTKVDTSKPLEARQAGTGARITPVLRSLDSASGEAEFFLCEVPIEEARKKLLESAEKSTKYDPWAKRDGDSEATAARASGAVDPSSVVGSLKFQLSGDVLSFDFDAPRSVHAPVVRVLGVMEQATFSGCEYLEKGERSSSTADIETSEYLRYAPPVYWTTAPFGAIVTERGSVSLLYDNPKSQAVFACPDFIDGDENSCRINVCAKKGSGKIRVGKGLEPLEEAILWSVQTRGLPDIPVPPRVGEEEEQFILAGLEKSALKTPMGWVHALGSAGPPYPFKPSYGSDFVSTIWEIKGELPDIPRLDYGGGHIRNYVSILLMNQGQSLCDRLASSRKGLIAQQKPDGSWRYSGRFLKGHWTDYASGDCGNKLFSLMEDWRLTKNQDSLDAALKGLEFVNKLKTPRGAQTWELSLHTPDIMGSSRCMLANIFAYEATGDQKYIDAARRWALTGIPFVYLWEDPELTPGQQPMMRYATIAVFGATGWKAPNWMGRPVQWCGLDYGYALLLFAKYDKTLDWGKIGEGIVASAECQLYDDEDFIGLLPDSFQLETQEKYIYNINPTVVSMLRRMIDGKPTNVSVVDCAGRRVVSPFPARVEGNTVKISANKGVKYQVMIDGQEVKSIESQGEDALAF